jgi:hypothetical protein
MGTGCNLDLVLVPNLDSRAAAPTHTPMADFARGLDASKLILAEAVRFYL